MKVKLRTALLLAAALLLTSSCQAEKITAKLPGQSGNAAVSHVDVDGLEKLSDEMDNPVETETSAPSEEGEPPVENDTPDPEVGQNPDPEPSPVIELEVDPATSPDPDSPTDPEGTDPVDPTTAPADTPLDDTEAPSEEKSTSWTTVVLLVVVAAALVEAAVILLMKKRETSLKTKITKLSGSPIPRIQEVPDEQIPYIAPTQPISVPPLSGPVQSVVTGEVHEQGTRDGQQDSYSVSSEQLLDSDGILAVVADGMGGLADGDKVSQTVVENVFGAFGEMRGEATQMLIAMLARAKYAVDMLLGPNGLRRSGSTVVMGLLKNGYFHYLSVGDSRISLYRDGQLYQLNRSHIYFYDLAVQGINGEKSFEEIRAIQKKDGLTSYLGMGDLEYVDIPNAPIKALAGDKFVLMSDGVFNALSDQELCQALDLGAKEAAAEIERRIKEKNFKYQDNYTAVILECCGGIERTELLEGK